MLSTTVREDDVSVIVLLRWISLGLLVFKRQNSSYSNGVNAHLSRARFTLSDMLYSMTGTT